MNEEPESILELSSDDWWNFYSSIPSLVGNSASEQKINSILSEAIKQKGWVGNVGIRAGARELALHLSFKRCKIIFHKKTGVLFDLGLLQNTRITKASILLSDCELKHCSNVINKEIKLISGNSFSVFNSKVEGAIVCHDVKTIHLEGTTTFSLNTTNATRIDILNSEVEMLTIDNSIESLSINKSVIFSLYIDDILTENKLKNLFFSQDSHIKVSAEESYRKLRLLCKKDILNNRIQTHLLYTKELEEHTTNGKKWDDKILFAINKLLNSHGRSFIQPIVVMYLFNVYLTFCLNLANSSLISFDLIQVITESFIMGLNISALSEYPTITSNMQYGIDGFRRVMLALFTYATISSALRFKFKE